MPARRYKLETCLGRGGFGEVYFARGDDGVFALKVLRADVDPKGQAAARLRDEARWLALINHPAIPRAHALVEIDARLGLLVEYVDGIDLSEALRGDDPPGPRAMLEVIGGIASALDAAWRTPLGTLGRPLGLVHRDIKPSNLRIRRHGGVALLDLGIARSDAVVRNAQTQTSGMVGSPGYFGPERFGRAAPEPSDDVFGLGAVLYEGLTGRRMLHGLSLYQLAELAAAPDRFDSLVADRLLELPPELPPAVADLVSAMVACRPSRRPTAAAVARTCAALSRTLPGPDLTAWCAAHPWAPAVRTKDGPWTGRTLSVSVIAQPDAPGNRATWIGVLVAFIVAALLGGLVTRGLRSLGEPAPPKPATEPVDLAPPPVPEPPAPSPTPTPVPPPIAPTPRHDSAAPSPPRPPAHATVRVDLPPDGSIARATLSHPRGRLSPVVLPTDVVPGTYVVTAQSKGAPLPDGHGTVAIDRPGVVRCALGICEITPEAPR